MGLVPDSRVSVSQMALTQGPDTPVIIKLTEKRNESESNLFRVEWTEKKKTISLSVNVDSDRDDIRFVQR